MIAQSGCPVGASPLDIGNESRIPIYTPEFAADPHKAYRQMRGQFGPLVPIWLAPKVAATLVIGYSTARKILYDPGHFPVDPRKWQAGVSPGCPVLPMMQWRPNALRSDGFDHARFRSANVDALGRVDLRGLHKVVERVAEEQIAGFCATGRADLLGDFAAPLVFEVVGEVIGCDPAISKQAATGMAMMFDTTDAARGSQLAAEALAELIARKRARPGEDITSWLLAHPTTLSDEELIHQLFCLYAAASEPLTNLIVNTLCSFMTREDFRDQVFGGSMSTSDALTHAMFYDPPIANFCMSYPRQPQYFDENLWVPAHQPIVISLAACNNDPDVVGGNIRHNRSHLGFGAGTHQCPAESLALLVAKDAIDHFLDHLPEIRLAVPADQLRPRPGPFHRALESLPVDFEPRRALSVSSPR